MWTREYYTHISCFVRVSEFLSFSFHYFSLSASVRYRVAAVDASGMWWFYVRVRLLTHRRTLSIWMNWNSTKRTHLNHHELSEWLIHIRRSSHQACSINCSWYARVMFDSMCSTRLKADDFVTRGCNGRYFHAVKVWHHHQHTATCTQYYERHRRHISNNGDCVVLNGAQWSEKQKLSFRLMVSDAGRTELWPGVPYEWR